MTTRYQRIGYTSVAALGLFVGAAGISAAATGTDSEPAPASEIDEADEADDGVNCENGIDTATNEECDGGPAAAEADEADEANEAESGVDDEADDGVDHEFEGEEVGENGDGVPDADDATEAVSTD